VAGEGDGDEGKEGPEDEEDAGDAEEGGGRFVCADGRAREEDRGTGVSAVKRMERGRA
jgi:hypothetical protein